MADGALELASAELRFSTEGDSGLPKDVLTKQKVRAAPSETALRPLSAERCVDRCAGYCQP